MDTNITSESPAIEPSPSLAAETAITAPASAPANGDGIDQLLTEFDRQTAQPAMPERSAQQVSQPGKGDDLLIALAAMTAADNRASALQRQAYDREDSKAVLEMAQGAVSDATLPAEYVQRWLMAEYNTNADLKKAWDERYDSAEAQVTAKRVVDQTIKKLRREVDAMPDREITEDRAAVAHAMRSSGPPPAPRPVRYGDLTNADFEKEKEKLFG